MPSGVAADMESVCDGGVGPTLSQERGNLELSPGKSVSLLQVRQAPLSRAVRVHPASLFLKLPAQLPHLPHRLAQLSEKLTAVALEI